METFTSTGTSDCDAEARQLGGYDYQGENQAQIGRKTKVCEGTRHRTEKCDSPGEGEDDAGRRGKAYTTFNRSGSGSGAPLA
jgi:hypothetical protein